MGNRNTEREYNIILGGIRKVFWGGGAGTKDYLLSKAFCGLGISGFRLSLE